MNTTLALRPPFWWRLEHYADAPCLFDSKSGREFSYQDLLSAADSVATTLYKRTAKSLVFLSADLTISTVVHFVAAARAGQAVHLYRRALPDSMLSSVIAHYAPEYVIRNIDPLDYRRFEAHQQAPSGQIHPGLRLILSTSGSTGSSKMVRLSDENLQSSADQITSALALKSELRSMLNMPLSYVYGFSVLNSVLSAGGCVVLDPGSFLDRVFWDRFASARATEIHGTPTSFDLLRQAWAKGLRPPTLARATQSGGPPSPELCRWLANDLTVAGVQVFKMYGLTEAASRVSVVPPSHLLAKSASVGVAVPGGHLQISEAGEVVYSGPNVMMGYAADRTDLAHGDLLGGVLPTGDLGFLDKDGYLYLEGRADRTVKINGLRLNLDDLEHQLARHGEVGVGFANDKLILACCPPVDTIAQARHLMGTIGLAPHQFRLISVDTLPRLPNGKVDYPSLTTL